MMVVVATKTANLKRDGDNITSLDNNILISPLSPPYLLLLLMLLCCKCSLLGTAVDVSTVIGY